MAVTSFDPRGPYILPKNGSMPTILYGINEANSQTFKAGHLVRNNSGIALDAGGDAPVLGIALKDATNVSSGNIEIPVMIIDPEDIVVFTVATNADVAQAANTTCAIGTSYDTNASVAYPSYIDSSDTGNPAWRFQGAVYDAAGNATNRGYFRLAPAETQVWEG